jgi:hypothetical protein
VEQQAKWSAGRTVLGATVLGNNLTRLFQYGVKMVLLRNDLEPRDWTVSQGCSCGRSEVARTYRRQSTCTA